MALTLAGGFAVQIGCPTDQSNHWIRTKATLSAIRKRPQSGAFTYGGGCSR